jgi:hypothetical protein
MRFKTRSIQQVLIDLTDKLGELPPNHPERPALVRMVAGLRADLSTRRAAAEPSTQVKTPT